MKDFRGVEIQVGDTVVYPGRQGSSMWMSQALVKEVKENTLIVEVEQRKWDGVVVGHRTTTVYRTDRCVVVS